MLKIAKVTIDTERAHHYITWEDHSRQSQDRDEGRAKTGTRAEPRPGRGQSQGTLRHSGSFVSETISTELATTHSIPKPQSHWQALLPNSQESTATWQGPLYGFRPSLKIGREIRDWKGLLGAKSWLPMHLTVSTNHLFHLSLTLNGHKA